jgi:hypothetical protein
VKPLATLQAVRDARVKNHTAAVRQQVNVVHRRRSQNSILKKSSISHKLVDAVGGVCVTRGAL